MARRLNGQFSAASMADIAFLLLIFFLVTTTMDIDTGMIRLLPPPSDQPPPEFHDRNVWVVLVNSNDKLMVEGKEMPIYMLREKTKEFLINPDNKENLPEKRIEDIEYIGVTAISKGIISLKNDRATSYGMFIKVMNELIAAGREAKNEFSMKKFGKNYDELPNHLKIAVKSAIPVIISESEPMEINN